MHVVELRFQMMQEICEIACYSRYSPDCSNVSIASHGNTVVMITLLPCQHCYCDPVLFCIPYTANLLKGKIFCISLLNCESFTRLDFSLLKEAATTKVFPLMFICDRICENVHCSHMYKYLEIPF